MENVIIPSEFLKRRNEQIEAERTAAATAIGKERFSESRSETERGIMESIARISDAVHPKVEAMLSTPARKFLTIDEDGFRLSVRHFFYERLGKLGYGIDRVDVPMKACLDYMEELVFDVALMKPRGEMIVSDPYVSSWKEANRYDLAGDAAMIGYMFYHRKKGNRLTRRDYADMGIRAYYGWYDQGLSRHQFNVGKHVAERLPRVLPILTDCPEEVFGRRFRLA